VSKKALFKGKKSQQLTKLLAWEEVLLSLDLARLSKKIKLVSTGEVTVSDYYKITNNSNDEEDNLQKVAPWKQILAYNPL
jgi:hypothetical protein